MRHSSASRLRKLSSWILNEGWHSSYHGRALENARIDPKSLAGSDTAVFMGIDSDDYSRLILEDLLNIEAWSGIEAAYHGIPNRISYHLDLMRFSTAVDAACASSLIAVHLGRQAVLSSESDVAIVDGVNILCAPALTHMLTKAGTLSPDGVCISFDDDANGYARGEGGAIVVLKRPSNAIATTTTFYWCLKGLQLVKKIKPMELWPQMPKYKIWSPERHYQELAASTHSSLATSRHTQP